MHRHTDQLRSWTPNITPQAEIEDFGPCTITGTTGNPPITKPQYAN